MARCALIAAEAVMNRFVNTDCTRVRSEMRDLGLIHLRLPIGVTLVTSLVLLGLVNIAATIMSLLGK
jgi:hypothetical protein